MVYKHAVVAAFHIYAQHGEDAAKRGGWSPCSHGNYIVDHGKSWKNHGLVILNFCGNPVFIDVKGQGTVILTFGLHVWFVTKIQFVDGFLATLSEKKNLVESKNLASS